MLSEYTNFQEVRAVLGLTTTELPDSVLSLPMYETLLAIQLEDIDVTLPNFYLTISALPSESRSATQARFFDLTRLFSAYATAKELLTSLPMLGVQKLSDGRAEFTRQSEQWSDIVDGVDAAFTSLRLRLAAAYNVLAPSALVPSYTTSIMTSYVGMTDPVTGI